MSARTQNIIMLDGTSRNTEHVWQQNSVSMSSLLKKPSPNSHSKPPPSQLELLILVIKTLNFLPNWNLVVTLV